MLQNFPSYSPEDFSKVLEEVRQLPDNYRPQPEELQKAVRGYAEINRLYRAACFDSRRGPYVRMHFNPGVGEEANVLRDLYGKFFAQIRDLADGYGIPAQGYSICVQDKSFLTVEDECEYFVLAEILDGHLRPAIIGPSCVESLKKAPVAFMVGLNSKGDGGYIYPILTNLAYTEVIQKINSTPLHELKQTPTPSHGFSLICEAIRRSLDSSDSPSKWSAHSEPRAAADTGKLDFLYMPSDIEYVSDAVQELAMEGPIHSPVFKVVCNFYGSLHDFKIEFSRRSKFGQVTAVATNVTEKLDDNFND